MSDGGVVTNKLSVEVGESKEGADVLHLGRGGPIPNSIKFSGSILMCPRDSIIPR